MADLPNSAGVLLDRWLRARRQLDQVGLPDALLQAARSRLDEGALGRLRTANIGTATPGNIQEQWRSFLTRLQRLPRQVSEAPKSSIFQRLLRAAVANMNSDLWWMASLIFSEAGSAREPWEGKLAVGWVVMNREAIQRWTGFRVFGTTIRGIISGSGQFDGYNNCAWRLAMEFYENPTIHDRATIQRDLRDCRDRINEVTLRDNERRALLLCLRAASIAMNRTGNDPTIGGFDGLGATFFAGSYNNAQAAKRSATDLVGNDKKRRIGNHEFWDRSLEWYWCEWRARHLPRGVTSSDACRSILAFRHPEVVTPEEYNEIIEGVQELNLRNRPRR